MVEVVVKQKLSINSVDDLKHREGIELNLKRKHAQHFIFFFGQKTKELERKKITFDNHLDFEN